MYSTNVLALMAVDSYSGVGKSGTGTHGFVLVLILVLVLVGILYSPYKSVYIWSPSTWYTVFEDPLPLCTWLAFTSQFLSRCDEDGTSGLPHPTKTTPGNLHLLRGRV